MTVCSIWEFTPKSLWFLTHVKLAPTILFGLAMAAKDETVRLTLTHDDN